MVESPLQPTSLEDLKSKTLHGLTFLIAREFIIKIFAFLGQLILFRILSPSLFGIYAILIFITGAFDLFSDIGFSSAIIQKKNIEKKEISTIFGVKQLLGITLFVLIYLSSPYIISLYHLSPVYTLALRIMALYLIIKPLRTILIALLEKNINYSSVSIIEILGIVIYQITVIVLAINGFMIWSFVWAIIIKEIAELLLAVIYNPTIPKPSFNLNKIKKLTHFGIYIQGQGIISFLHTSLSPLIVGLRINPQAVGYNDLANNIAYVPQSITDNFGRVAFASFSQIQDNAKLLSKAIEKSIKILSLITSLFFVLIFGFGNELLSTVFTAKWQPTIQPLYWFSIATIFVAGMSAIGQGLLVLGKSKQILYASTFLTFFETILAYCLVTTEGFVGISIASAIIAIFAFFIYYYLAKKSLLSISITNIFFSRLIIIISTLLSIFVFQIFLPHTFLFLLIKTLEAIVFYIFISFLVSPNEIKELFSLIKKLFI